MARPSVAGIAGDVFAFLLTIAPVETMIRIKRDNNVGERTVYNYVGTWANAVAWVGYGAPTASTRGWYVPGINMGAMLAYLFYTAFYLHYAHGRARRIAWWAIGAELGWGVAMAAVYIGAFSGGRNEDARVIFFGWLSAVITVIMYLAMIPNMAAVCRTHDLSQQGILLLLAAVGNTSSWTAFGDEKPGDPFVLCSNAIGVLVTGLLTIWWVSLWINYRCCGAAQQPPPPHNVELQDVVPAAAA